MNDSKPIEPNPIDYQGVVAYLWLRDAGVRLTLAENGGLEVHVPPGTSTVEVDAVVGAVRDRLIDILRTARHNYRAYHGREAPPLYPAGEPLCFVVGCPLPPLKQIKASNPVCHYHKYRETALSIAYDIGSRELPLVRAMVTSLSDQIASATLQLVFDIWVGRRDALRKALLHEAEQAAPPFPALAPGEGKGIGRGQAEWQQFIADADIPALESAQRSLRRHQHKAARAVPAPQSKDRHWEA